MRYRRLVVLPALAAALFAAAGAFANPTLSPQILQCDGTYVAGGATHHPSPSIQTIVQDAVGLRIGKSRMGLSASDGTRELWRFDAQAAVTDLGCNPDVTCPFNGNCWTFSFQYTDPNGSGPMQIGTCTYDSDCASSNDGLIGNNVVGTCPNPGALPLGSPQTVFPAGASGTYPLGNFVTAGSFDGSTTFGSVTYTFNGQGDRASSYTLSAWVKSSAGGLQRIVSEQGPAGFWGFGLNGGALRLFDSRNTTGGTDVSLGAGINNGAWHKIDVVRNNGLQERFFVDGGLIGFVAATSTDSFTAHPISHPIMIGAYEGLTEKFNGQIDEIRVRDAAVSDEDIRLEYLGSNLHKFSNNPATPYGYVLGGFPGGVTNGFATAATYTPAPDGVSPNITFATQGNLRWVFEAQNIGTASSVLSTFTATIDNTVPTSPGTLSGTPTGTSAITWTWAVPSHFCQPPGSASVIYRLSDAAVGPAELFPPGDILYPLTSISEGGLTGPNQIHSRRLSATDTWGTGPLTPSASAYTLAATPVSLTATSVSSGGFIATWNGSGNPPSYTRYELTYSADPNFVIGVSTRVGLGDNFIGSSINVTGLSAGATYYARVRAFNGQNSDSFGGIPTGYSSTLAVVTVPPGPALAGTPLSNSSIQWTWTLTNGATGYTLYDSPTQAVMFGPQGAALSFTSNTLSVNRRYDAEVEADLPAPTPPTSRGHASAFTLANAPTLTTVAAVFATSATFAWNANGNPAYTFYQVIVATDPAFGIVTATLTVTSPSATATGLLPGVTYYSRVQAINGGQIAAPPFAYVAIPQAATAPDPEITLNSAPPSPYVSAAGLVLAWQFDENTGTTTADATGQGNTGNFGCVTSACVSTPTFAAGPVGLGSAASFSGLAGGRVLTANNINIPGSVTVEAWVNPVTPAQTANAGIVGVGAKNSEDFAIDVSPAGAFEFLTSNGGVEIPITVATATIKAGQWTHVVGVYDLAHTSATLYLNGVPVAVQLGMPARPNTALPLAVGNRKDAAGNVTLPFAGAIDSVRVFNVALTPAQVLADYQGSFVSSVTPTAPNNGVIVALPPNAFGAPAQIFISADPVNHPIRITPAAMAAGLAVTPSGLTLVPNSLIEVVPVVGGLPFTTPLGSSATLTIPYKDPSSSGLISNTNPPLTAAGIRMYTLNTAVNAWVLLPTTVDKVNHSANGLTPHFSVFALFAPSTVGANLSGVKAFPVPWKPGSGGLFDGRGVTFSNLPASGTIRILTLAGRRVRDFTFNGVSAGSAVWDGLNDDGRRAASGVYFARVSSGLDGTTVLVKFAIER